MCVRQVPLCCAGPPQAPPRALVLVGVQAVPMAALGVLWRAERAARLVRLREAEADRVQRELLAFLALPPRATGALRWRAFGARMHAIARPRGSAKVVSVRDGALADRTILEEVEAYAPHMAHHAREETISKQKRSFCEPRRAPAPHAPVQYTHAPNACSLHSASISALIRPPTSCSVNCTQCAD